jgi:hypothetical protein
MPRRGKIGVQESTREENGLSPLARHRVMCYRRAGFPRRPAATRAGSAMIHAGMTVLRSSSGMTASRKEVVTHAHREGM